MGYSEQGHALAWFYHALGWYLAKYNFTTICDIWLSTCTAIHKRSKEELVGKKDFTG